MCANFLGVAGLWAKNAISSSKKLEDDMKSNNTDKSVRWGRMMTKLRLWERTEYERMVYLDADAFAMQVCQQCQMFAVVISAHTRHVRTHATCARTIARMCVVPSDSRFDSC